MAVASPMKTQFSVAQPKNGVLVLWGFGISVSVRNGALIVEDGIGSQRRKGQFYKANSGINRLVVIGHAGTVSLDALRWLNDVGAAFVHIDSDGNVIAATSPRGLNDARLRRAQALAATDYHGVEITGDLLRAKFSAQLEVLERIPETSELQSEILLQSEALSTCTNPRSFMLIESRAALAYWSGWKGTEIRFAKKELSRVPEHWRQFEARRSPISSASRLASTPINAMLNYLYAVLETEVRLAILTIGLDPGMALLHSDLKSRDSFVFDVIEPLRPVVDGYLLSLLRKRTFSIREFHETRQGVVRVMPLLAIRFAEFGSELDKIARPLVEQIAQRLAESTTNGFVVPTILTESNRSSGRNEVRTKPKVESLPIAIAVSAACLSCGVILEDATGKYCPDCFAEVSVENIEAFSKKGRARLQALRAKGVDPSVSKEANQKRSEIMKKHRQAEIEWDAQHPGQVVDDDWFKSTIVPALRGFSLGELSVATGLSQQYCSLIKRGLKIPHPMHVEQFAKLDSSESTGRADQANLPQTN